MEIIPYICNRRTDKQEKNMTQAELNFYTQVPTTLRELARAVAELTKEVKEMKATLKDIEQNMD